MTAELLDKLTDELAESTVAKIGPKLLTLLRSNAVASQPDPLLTTKEVAARLGVSESKVRELVAGGYLQRAKGMSEIRVRQSVVDAYGTKP